MNKQHCLLTGHNEIYWQVKFEINWPNLGLKSMLLNNLFDIGYFCLLRYKTAWLHEKYFITKVICQSFEGSVKYKLLLQLQIFVVAIVQYYCTIAYNLFQRH